MGSILVGFSLVFKYYTRVEVNISGKHSSLLRNGNSYGREKFYSIGRAQFNLVCFITMKNCTLTTTINKNSILVQHSGFARLVQHSGLHFVAMVINHDATTK